MNVSLTPHLESLVKGKVESGLYNSSSEVIREALRLLDDRDRLREMRLADLREAIQQGIDSGPAGLLDVETIKSEGRKQLKLDPSGADGDR